MMACDPYTTASVINQSDTFADVIIQFQSDHFDHDNGTIEDELYSGLYQHIRPISIDTVNYISHFRLNLSDTLMLCAHLGTEPQLDFKKIILITKQDTLSFHDMVHFKERLVRKTGHMYVFNVQNPLE